MRVLDMNSLWLSASRAPVDTGEPPGETGVAIVGAGLLGVCCAYWLARMGADVILLERDAVASGATGRNSGLVIPTTAEPYDQAVRTLGATVAAAVRRLAEAGADTVVVQPTTDEPDPEAFVRFVAAEVRPLVTG